MIAREKCSEEEISREKCREISREKKLSESKIFMRKAQK